MKAITVEPMKAGSARLEDVPEPDAATARSSSRRSPSASAAPTPRSPRASTAGRPRARPASSSATSRSAGCSTRGRACGLKKGDLVVGIVRRPDPVPCPNCAVGEWDMCRNGQYTERGIKAIHGFMSERWRIEPEYAIKVDSVARAARRAPRADDGRRQGDGAGGGGRPSRVLGAARRSWSRARARSGCSRRSAASLRGLEVHVLDRMESGAKPDSSAPSARPTTPAACATSASSRTSSSSAPASAQVIADSIPRSGRAGSSA